MNDPIRILVVDDDPDILSGTSRLLERAGYTVDTASTGEASLQAVGDHCPDLLLLDRHLPGIDGLEVCRRVKLNPTLSDVFVVIISASYTQSDEQAEGLESGADGYINRPITNRELLARVESFARIHRLTRSLRLHTQELEKGNEAVRQAHLVSLKSMDEAVVARDRAEQASQALRLSEERFRRVSEATSDFAYSCVKLPGGAFTFDWLTGAVERITGWSRNELFEWGCWKALVLEDDMSVFEEQVIGLAPGDSSVCELRIRDRQGRIRWLKTYSKVGSDADNPAVRLLHGACQDITERKQAEEKLVQSHELLANLTRLVPGVVYQYRLYPDGRSTFPYSSPGMCDIYEVTPEEVRDDASPVFGRLHPEDHDRVGASILESARTLQEFFCEFRVILPRQGLCWRWSQAHPERMEDGGTLWHGIISDITERKQVEAEKARLEGQLLHAQKMESVGRLAGGVAHDFNNIMQAMLSLATVLRMRVNSPELGKIVTEIEAHIMRGAGLTQQLLQFSRRQMMEMKRLDLGELVSTTGVLLRRLIPERIRFTIDTTPERLWVDGDVGQLQQVLMNLAINAKDAMPGNGTLTVGAKGERGEAVIEVIDTGHGMDEATRERLFEPFFTTKEFGKGTGLGLSVVHGIVGGHGGRIEVESAPGEGSRFRVILPAMPTPEQPTGTLNPDTEAPLGHGERVLVVEDETGAREGLSELLAILGYTVTAVGSGEEAGVLPVEPAPALLLTDLMLPGIDGAALAAKLRARWPQLKVVLMSGYTEDEALRCEVGKGTLRFLQKPFDVTALALAVGETLAGRG